MTVSVAGLRVPANAIESLFDNKDIGPVWPNEVVIAAQQLEVLFEPLLRSRVAQRSPQKVGRALPDGQVQPLDERRVQCRGVLRVIERFFESPRGSNQLSSFDLQVSIMLVQR